MVCSNPVIFCLDLGTKTGWALYCDELITSGTVEFKNDRYSGGGMRFLKFKNWLNGTLKTVGNIDAIYFEEVRKHLGVDAAHIYGGFLAHLSSFCEQNKIPYSGVPVGTIKRHISGKGNANKKQVTQAVYDLGYFPEDDNEADAIALIHFVLDNNMVSI